MWIKKYDKKPERPHQKVVDNQVRHAMKNWAPNRNPEVFIGEVQRQAERREKNRKLREFTEQMDLSAQDNHMKYERDSFAVVTASEAYRRGWEIAFGKEKLEAEEASPGE